jgi:hypothetical protein
MQPSDKSLSVFACSLLLTKPVKLQASNALFVRDLAFVNNRIQTAPKIQLLGAVV